MRKRILCIVLSIGLTIGLSLTAYASETDLSGRGDVEVKAEEPEKVEDEEQEIDKSKIEEEMTGKSKGKEPKTDDSGMEDVETETEKTEERKSEKTESKEPQVTEKTESKEPQVTETTTEESKDKESGIEDSVTDETEETEETVTVSGNDVEKIALSVSGNDVEETAETETEEIQKVYSVEFPSFDNFSFILDPYGLRGMRELENATLEDLKPYAGKIYCDDTIMITNKSSVPIKLRVSFQITGDVNAVENIENVEKDEENNVLLCILPSENDVAGSIDNYKQSETAITVKKDTPTTVEFLLPQSDYSYEQSEEDVSARYSIVEGDMGHSVAFKISGLLNTRADWKAFSKEDKEVGLTVSYSYEEMSGLPEEGSLPDVSFGMAACDGTVINVSELEKGL